MGVPPKLTPDTVNENLGALKILSEEGLELWPRDGSGSFMALLVLSPSEADGTTEECNGEKDTIHPCGAWGFEIIFTLLIKMVTIHMRFSGIGFWGPSLEWALSRLCYYLSLGLRCLHKHLHEFREEVLGRRSERWSDCFGRDRSLIAPGIGSSCWALGAGKLIQFSSKINQSGDARTPAGSTRSWSHCKGWKFERDTFLPNRLADLLDMELLEL